MPRINSYTDNTTIENDDKLLTYDTHGAATKLTAFSTIWNWIVSKLHALTSSSAALTPSTDRVLMDKNGTMTRVEPAAVAKYGIETYNGSTIAGSAQTVKSALDALNSKAGCLENKRYYYGNNSVGTYTYNLDAFSALYLIGIAKINSSSNSIGIYVANPYDSSSGFLLQEIIPIGEQLAEISLSGTTLTVVTKVNYVAVGITRIA